MKKVTVKNIEFNLFGDVNIDQLVINPVTVTDTVRININGGWYDHSEMTEQAWDEAYGVEVTATARLAGVTIESNPIVITETSIAGGSSITLSYEITYVIPTHTERDIGILGEWSNDHSVVEKKIMVQVAATPRALQRIMKGEKPLVALSRYGFTPTVIL